MIYLEIAPSALPEKMVARISRQESQPRPFRSTLAILLVPTDSVSHIEADVKVLQQMSRDQQDAVADRLRALAAYPAPILEPVAQTRIQSSLF